MLSNGCSDKCSGRCISKVIPHAVGRKRPPVIDTAEMLLSKVRRAIPPLAVHRKWLISTQLIAWRLVRTHTTSRGHLSSMTPRACTKDMAQLSCAEPVPFLMGNIGTIHDMNPTCDRRKC